MCYEDALYKYTFYLLTYFTYFSHALKIITKLGIVAHAQEG